MKVLFRALSALLCCLSSSSHTLDLDGKNVCRSLRYTLTSEYKFVFILISPFSCFLWSQQLFVDVSSWLDTTVVQIHICLTDLIVLCIFREPSTLVCCTGWRQEGNECPIRKLNCFISTTVCRNVAFTALTLASLSSCHIHLFSLCV